MVYRILLSIFLLFSVIPAKATELPEGFSMSEITPQVMQRISGKSFPEEGGQISASELRYLQVMYYDFDGAVQQGELICNRAIADDLLDIFSELYKARYQIASVCLIDEFDADDVKSMDANNTSCFNHRVATGSTKLSKHAMGLAIDINPVQNPYVKDGTVLPLSGGQYQDRKSGQSHMITTDDLCYRLFTEHGFTWGGSWRSVKDYQHFEK